ncbi:MAG TPA: site-specific DNA-methyltransferase [Nitrososphaerales archaeon]|nr:site-specific DNA-methyltransferase [Nitrososphaerales archaeon]
MRRQSETCNTIILGDAVEILETIDDSSARLFYLDPPFLTQRRFLVESGSETSAAFDDIWEGGIRQYSEWIKPLLMEVHRILGARGSLYVHLDDRVSHYVKVMLDQIFGLRNFRNEIIWKRQSSHNDPYQGARSYGRIHDVILFYTKTENYTWNQPFLPYDEGYLRRKYRFVEKQTNRRYALGDLTGPGGLSKGNAWYEFLGVSRYWRYSKKRMCDLHEAGRIVQTKPGNVPLMKRYLDEMHGKPAQDIWDDIKLVRGKESAGYPTQKPLRLLERIVLVSTDPGDLVIDPTCGSGSTLVAAERLGRRWLGVDDSVEACRVALSRLQDIEADVSLVELSPTATTSKKARSMASGRLS